jgi:nitrogenase molybdenum-iron protein alpha chain
MPTIAAGYEFAHRDDYEGREVLPNIKVDADSRNIEELTVWPAPKKYNPRKTEEAIEALKGKGFTFSDYEGMMKQMNTNALLVDDITHWETEKLVEFFKPAVFCAGIKEKYAVQKMGVPLKQLHSYDYGGPYAGFEGAINFYREMERIVGTKIWEMIKVPWEGEPELIGTVGVEA